VSAVATGRPRLTLTERTKRAPRWLTALVMSMIAIGTIYPVVFVLNVSLKDKKSYILDKFGLTDALHTGNFGDAWRRSNLSRYMINSTIVTAGSVAVLLLLGSWAGYAFAQLSFKISKGAYLACLGALMIPFQVIMVPFVRMMLDINLTNTYWGLIIAYTSIFLPFTVYLMSSFYRRIPRSITEAATIDGASVWDTYRRIILPIGKPALLSVGILNALFVWNDVLVSLLMMPEEQKRTLMIGVSALRGQYSSNVPVFAAGVLIAAFPVIVVYIVFQRQIAAGVTAGATKG
jgi:multiple sugar transport system permease protein